MIDSNPFLGDEMVPCEMCGNMTYQTGTKRCDFCWELGWRIKARPEIARKIIGGLDDK